MGSLLPNRLSDSSAVSSSCSSTLQLTDRYALPNPIPMPDPEPPKPDPTAEPSPVPPVSEPAPAFSAADNRGETSGSLA